MKRHGHAARSIKLVGCRRLRVHFLLMKPSERTVMSPSPALRQLTYANSGPPRLTVIVKTPLPGPTPILMRYVSMKSLILPTNSLTLSRQLLILPSPSSSRGGRSSFSSFSLPARSPRTVYWTSPSPVALPATSSHVPSTIFSFVFTQPMVTRATLTPKGLTLRRSTPLPASRYSHPSSVSFVGPSYFPTLSERRYLSIASARPLRPSAMGCAPS
mmetsp:Transcript_20773/g.65026  ORF Transcript_20773/g.65026 Transcript_20773/m.65026 type:complete len:215 (-) Transcript_20773:136-780(-)